MKPSSLPTLSFTRDILVQAPALRPSASPSPEAITKLGTGFWGSKALLSAVELEVFTHLALRPGSLDDVRSRVGLHPRAARDFLDALVSLGLLQRENGIYLNTPETGLFLDKKKASYIGGILEMMNARLYAHWNHLTTALKTGEPQNEAKVGDDFFKVLYSDQERLAQFLKAMTGVSRGANLAIAKKFSWPKYRTFVDAGAAQGDLAAQVALAHPHLHGIGVDLPQAKPIFEDYTKQLGLADRLEFSAVDFFKQPLPKADVVIMGHILHDWDLPQKKRLIRAGWDALPPGGAFIAYDCVIDDDRRQNTLGLLMSLNMLIETPGGFDYTAADCMGWMKECGFRGTYVQHLAGADSMVVGIK